MIGRCAAFLAGLSKTGALEGAAAAAAADLRDAGIPSGDEEWRRRGAARDGAAAAALHADLLAHPDEPDYSVARDNVLRLAYASLIAATDHNRAELIRAQLEGKRPARARDLLGHHGRGWSAVKDLVQGYRFHRGFVGQVTLSAREFLERAARLYALEPITEVALRGDLRELGEAVFTSPLLRRLRSLDLAGQGIGDAGAARLAAAPHLANLQALNLDGNRLSIAGVRALASSAGLPRLRLASLAGNLDEVGSVESGAELSPLAEQVEEEYGRVAWLRSGAEWAQSEVEVAATVEAGLRSQAPGVGPESDG